MDLFEHNGIDITAGPDWRFEAMFVREGLNSVAGVDEVGRGPLAGPVVAAAVILSPDSIPEGLNDSKKLSEKKRELLHDQILGHLARGLRPRRSQLLRRPEV